MLAVYVESQSADEPLSGLVVGERPEPDVPDGWRRVHVQAASLNHHDLWSLRGVGLPPERLPMILGCDAAGVDDEGNEVLVHAVVSAGHGGDETLDPKRSILSEVHQGTFAEQVVVPARNVVPLPSGMSVIEASCLPTAWLTAYRMLFTSSGVDPGGTILVQGAGGGVATALITLGSAAGYRVWACSRDEAKRDAALELGAEQVFAAGARLPERVDAVMETVGQATWSHSMKALRPGGTVVVCGATTGPNPPADLNRLFFQQLRVIGSTMGTRDELARLVRFCEQTGVRPRVAATVPMRSARHAFEQLHAGDVVGKIVLTR